MTAAATVVEADFAQPQVSIRTVTPEMASTWLANNTHNRKLRKTLVESYARDMANGRWTVNGEAIQISNSGTLLNGQHRLTALVQAGVPVQMLVVTNLPESAQDTIDTGAKRQLGDVLKLAGYNDGKTLAAVAMFSQQIKHGKMYRGTDTERRQLVENDEVLQWVVANVLPSLPTHLASKTLFAYAYRVLHHIDPDDCAVFFTKLATLENLPPGSPILALHKRLISMDRKSASWTNRSHVLALIYIAWNAYRKGEERTLIKPYPAADGSFKIPDPV